MSEIQSSATAALIAGVIPTIWSILHQATAAHPLFTDLGGMLAYSLLVYSDSAAVVLVCGYVTLRALGHLSLIRWWTSGLAGIAWGSVTADLLGEQSHQIMLLLAWLAAAGLCGLTFWGVWRHTAR